MAEPQRVEELRRRVQRDPASIAFAALAEEYRKLGRFTEAIDTCRSGLARHPAYVSARLTLARSLSELGEYDAAASEFDRVLKGAPENLLARKGLADVLCFRGDLMGALDHLQIARAVAPQDPELPEAILAIQRVLTELPGPADTQTSIGPFAKVTVPNSVRERQLEALEAWLAVIQQTRESRRLAQPSR